MGVRIDQFPDSERDVEGNPINPRSRMTTGKYKDMVDNMRDIYKDDKGYVQWIRCRIGPTSQAIMKQFIVFIAYVHCNKIRINTQVTNEGFQQMPVVAPVSRPKTVKNPNWKKKGTPASSSGVMPVTPSDTEWEQMPMEEIVNQAATESWGRMAICAIDHQAK